MRRFNRFSEAPASARWAMPFALGVAILVLDRMGPEAVAPSVSLEVAPAWSMPDVPKACAVGRWWPDGTVSQRHGGVQDGTLRVTGTEGGALLRPASGGADAGVLRAAGAPSALPTLVARWTGGACEVLGPVRRAHAVQVELAPAPIGWSAHVSGCAATKRPVQGGEQLSVEDLPCRLRAVWHGPDGQRAEGRSVRVAPQAGRAVQVELPTPRPPRTGLTAWVQRER